MYLKLNGTSFSRDIMSHISARVAFQLFHALRQIVLFQLTKN